MKLWSLLFVFVLLGASAYIYHVDTTPQGVTEYKVVDMGWPLPWLRMNATLEGNTTTTSYNIIWQGLVIDLAVYVGAIVFISWIFF